MHIVYVFISRYFLFSETECTLSVFLFLAIFSFGDTEYTRPRFVNFSLIFLCETECTLLRLCLFIFILNLQIFEKATIEDEKKDQVTEAKVSSYYKRAQLAATL